MNEEVIEVLKETKTLLDMIDSLASEDISDDLSDSLSEWAGKPTGFSQWDESEQTIIYTWK